ncbi:hypothetical protein JN11_01597 [Mucilaginibacter frigoritolerans]|uniref:MG2 domain-containing protein n=1 Tax=Mucilaginibacter frigoritolerans TaxID=652788 RepID=A0A562U6N3_9SPHI|nr:MG2 domain-containing protein [Mucilaginibacter frigoritolerans]TWJ01446.1 hypothetical protein JN11_01597 [Mucilaginibacter frigoritolerans]
MNLFPSLNLSRKQLTSAAVVFIIFLTAITLLVKRQHKTSVNPAFSKYIESYTSGIVSRKGIIRIKLANEVKTSHAQNEPLPDGSFSFSPAVAGKAYWVDAQTIAFKPETEMEADKFYEAKFDLGKVASVPGDLQHFNFWFQTIKPDFTIEFNGLQTATSTSLDKMKLSGVIKTSDTEDPERVERIITKKYPSEVTVTWQHDNANNTHTFTIDNISRPASGSSQLLVSWDGSTLNMEKSSNQAFDIPAIGIFRVLDIRAVQDQDQYVEIQFSNPIMVGQELNGLTGIRNINDAAYTIDGSKVKVYAPDHLQGDYIAFVNEGVKDISHNKINAPYLANLFFENRLPEVTIPGKGVILPDSGRLMLPFEAANLKAVDVSIIKIYESNVPQFLQNNDLSGEQQLRQVAKPVVQTTIRLDDDKTLDLTKKKRFMLDLDHLMHTEPGAIYRVIIGFRKEYSLFNCKVKVKASDNSSSTVSDEEGEGYEGDNDSYGNKIDEDDAFWSRYDSYYPQGYKWDEKDDPCSTSFYTKDKWASRNIIASNIGLIAKYGSDNHMLIATTNIINASPMAGVELTLLDYQKQIITKVSSDDNGFANFTIKRKPYLLLAKKGEERGYLKLDDGSALALSKFDVGGEQIQNGLKGFIYGERGVWRPGDSIFVSFILEDKLKTLPPDHPVQFELYNPQGQLYRRIIRTSAIDGFYSFHTATTTGSPTGTWTAKVKVGGAQFEKPIKVETIMPNRLKIDLSFGGKTSLTKGSGANGVLKSTWLFGGIAQNLKAKVDAFVSALPTSFKGFKDYVFDDPTLAFNTQTQTVFDGRLNAEGTAAIDANIHVEKQAPGQLRANFLVKVFEPGGNFSIQQVALPYNAYTGYVGIKTPEGSEYSGMLNVDQDNPIDIADVDVNGNPFPGSRSVTVELYKIQWRWWWDQTGDDLSNFTQNQYNNLISTQTVDLTNGRGTWNLKVKQDNWGRYLIRIKDQQTGHSTGKIVYVDWAERLQQTNATNATMLSFTSDKKSYKVGETATLTIPTGNDGRALISFENGSKVLKSVWVDTHQGQTIYQFKVDGSMAPNVFVNVTMLQHHSQTVNDLPIRMYGVIPLTVDDPATVLKPVIGMPDKIRPESKTSITVSEAHGKEMTYTVAIVDEGLLDLTNFKTPNPHQTFYAREALGVKTWDLFDFVIGAYGGDLERILSIGGDESLGNNKNVSVNRFKPVVKFLGPFHLNAGEKQTHSFTLPQYIGSVRTMVIAGHNGAYGFSEKAVAVKKPLMLLATLPRVLGPTEKIKLPVTVFAMENSIKTVTVQVQSNAFSNLQGRDKQTLTFNAPGDQLATFDLDVKDFVGIGKVKITATSGSETASYDVELNVRNPNPPITKITGKELKPGEVWSEAYAQIGMAGTNKATLEVSSVPSLNLAKRLSYLIDYPHGCVEQTTSAAFPQLYLDQLTDLTPQQKASAERNIKAAISRLTNFQTPSGGLSYWPGESEVDEWCTNYAGNFMLAAQANGYSLPVGFLDGWKRYQRQKAVNWAPDTRSFYGSDLVQAYRLYLLALARVPELGAMNRLKEFKYLSPQAKWRLAAAYKLAGQPEEGLQMINGLPLTIKPYYQLYGTYGSDLRDEAMILESLTLLDQHQKAAGMLQTVASHLSQDDWYSTQTTAYALLAIAEYCGQNKNGNKLQFIYGNSPVNSASYLWQANLPVNGGKASIKNIGKNILYLRLIQQGQPAPGQEPASVNNDDILKMKVNYITMKGQPIDINNLKQGTDFVAQVTIANPGHRGRYDNMALTQIFPSGWEILNTRMLNNDEAFKSSASNYQDIRDDRVNTYFGLDEGQQVTYYVMLNAAYTGRYYLPATYCEAMYNSTINALQKGRWVEVKK